ncbi:MAG: hypothetical protein IPH04_02970 [Saprospirales bacterium]|nr:hypothetical protein [Saprospirales bacterium]
MKKLLITGITAISFLFTSFSQPPYECYFPFEEGISFQRTYYDASGQVTAISNAGIDSIAKMGHFTGPLSATRCSTTKIRKSDAGYSRSIARTT